MICNSRTISSYIATYYFWRRCRNSSETFKILKGKNDDVSKIFRKYTIIITGYKKRKPTWAFYRTSRFTFFLPIKIRSFAVKWLLLSHLWELSCKTIVLRSSDRWFKSRLTTNFGDLNILWNRRSAEKSAAWMLPMYGQLTFGQINENSKNILCIYRSGKIWFGRNDSF